MKLLFFALLIFSVNVQAQNPAAPNAASAKQRAEDLQVPVKLDPHAPHPVYMVACKPEVDKYCAPFRSHDSTSVTCMEKKYLAGEITLSNQCLPAFKLTLSAMHAAEKNPPAYSDKGTYTSEQRMALIMLHKSYVRPPKNPGFSVDCAAEGDRYCQQYPTSSSDMVLCLKDKFLMGTNISQKCFHPFLLYVNWIEKAITEGGMCIDDYNRYCRQENTGDGVSDCLMAHISTISQKCAAYIKKTRPEVLRDKASKATAAKVAPKAQPANSPAGK